MRCLLLVCLTGCSSASLIPTSPQDAALEAGSDSSTDAPEADSDAAFDASSEVADAPDPCEIQPYVGSCTGYDSKGAFITCDEYRANHPPEKLAAARAACSHDYEKWTDTQCVHPGAECGCEFKESTCSTGGPWTRRWWDVFTGGTEIDCFNACVKDGGHPVPAGTP